VRSFPKFSSSFFLGRSSTFSWVRLTKTKLLYDTQLHNVYVNSLRKHANSFFGRPEATILRVLKTGVNKTKFYARK